MPADTELRDGRLTLARVHAALGVISAAMIGQIISASTLTHELRLAVWWFGLSVLLNAFFFVLEADPLSPRIESQWLHRLFRFSFHMAVIAALTGMGCVISHVSPTAGLLFITIAYLMLGFHVLVNQRGYQTWCHWRVLRREFREYARLSAEYKQETEKLKVEFAEYEKLSDELHAATEELSNATAQLATTVDDLEQNQRGEPEGRVQRNDVQETRAKLEAQIRLREGLLRRYEELQRRREELDRRFKSLERFPPELDRHHAKLMQIRAETERIRHETDEWQPKVLRDRKSETVVPTPSLNGQSGH